jgi:hypothetical protein
VRAAVGEVKTLARRRPQTNLGPFLIRRQRPGWSKFPPRPTPPRSRASAQLPWPDRLRRRLESRLYAATSKAIGRSHRRGSVLVPPRDAASLAAVLTDLVSDPSRTGYLGHPQRTGAITLPWDVLMEATEAGTTGDRVDGRMGRRVVRDTLAEARMRAC